MIQQYFPSSMFYFRYQWLTSNYLCQNDFISSFPSLILGFYNNGKFKIYKEYN